MAFPEKAPAQTVRNVNEIDFRNPAFVADPYLLLGELRAAGQPIWDSRLGMWLAARYADANAVLRSKTLGRIFTPREPRSEWEVFNWLHSDSILDCEPPKHTRLRGLVSKAFTRARIDGLRPEIERLAEQLLSAAEMKLKLDGRFDAIADYAEPLPVMVIAALLGIPREDEHLLRPWSQAIVKMYEFGHTTEQEANARRAAEDFTDYIRKLMERRRREPGNDLISELAAVEESGEKLSAQELIATCILLLNAGHEASVNGLGNGLVALLRRPDQREVLATRPHETAATAIEEFLRFDAPLQLFERTATEDTEIGAITVRKGQKIAALLGAANRDREVFDHADEMNVLREPNPHIGFGAGIHFCLGAPLARLELSISVAALFERFPKLRMVEEPKRRPTFVLRGYEAITVDAGA